MTRVRLSRIFWIGAAAILVVAALIALAAVLRGEFSDNDGRILVTLGALLYTGGSALAALALADRGPARALGWIAVVAAPVCLGQIAWAVWSFAFDGDGNESVDKLAWSSAIVVLAGLIATTALLLARSGIALVFAAVAASLGALTAGLTILAVWAEPSSDAYPKVIGVLGILTVLAYFLAPVAQRLTPSAVTPEVRVLATLDDVELVAVRGHVNGVAVDAPARGERLMLRHRS